jgi:hypothetical protein
MNAPLSPRPHVGGHAVGDGEPVFCVAEVGTTAIRRSGSRARSSSRVGVRGRFRRGQIPDHRSRADFDKTAVYRYQTSAARPR